MSVATLSLSGYDGFSRGEAVYEVVRNAIQNGTIAPGERIRELELAKVLGVSRTPVRDAVKQLTSEGLLIAEPRRGLVVAEFDRRQVLEVYALREILEGGAAALAAASADESDIATLRAILRQEAANMDSTERLSELNRAFHRNIYTAAHNRYIIKPVNDLAEALRVLPGSTMGMPGRAKSSHEQHTAIVDAIERRDADEAEALARQHIREAKRLRLQLLFEQGF
jgi:DNA-binding GntR family transcriptional regulator